MLDRPDDEPAKEQELHKKIRSLEQELAGQKTLIELLSDQNKHFRDRIENVSIGLGTITRKPAGNSPFGGKFLQANKHLVRLLEIPQKAPEDSDLAVYLRKLIKDHDQILPQMNLILEKGDGLKDFIFRSTSNKLCSISLTPATYLNMEVYSIEIRDLTKEMQVDRLQSEVEFLQLITAGLAHELKTPLSAIQTNLDLLSMTNEFNDKSEIKVGNISYLVSRTSQLIDRIFAFTRLYNGDVNLFKSPLRYEEIFNEMKKLYELNAKKNGVDLICITEDTEDTLIHTDDFWVSQALSIVIENSIKYAEGGGVTTVKYEYIRDADAVKFTVTDDGKGIDRGNLETIFEFMKRGDGVESKNGIGLGLNFAKTIVELLDGTIIAESPGAGKGSTFTLRFPNLAEVQSEM